MNAMVHLQLAELRIGIWIFQVDQNPVQDLADNFLRGNCVPNVQLVPSLPSPPRNKSSALPVLAGAAGLLPKEDAFLFKSIESIVLIALLQTFGIRQLLIWPEMKASICARSAGKHAYKSLVSPKCGTLPASQSQPLPRFRALSGLHEPDSNQLICWSKWKKRKYWDLDGSWFSSRFGEHVEVPSMWANTIFLRLVLNRFGRNLFKQDDACAKAICYMIIYIVHVKCGMRIYKLYKAWVWWFHMVSILNISYQKQSKQFRELSTYSSFCACIAYQHISVTIL